MPATPQSRINGITTSVAVKAPCQVATTAAITLSGLQTINGLAVTETDRVLVKDQADPVDNGIYYPSTGTWTRAPDFDGNLDAVDGTRILVGTSLVYSTVCADGAVVFGTSEITFILSGVGAGTNVVSVTDFASIQDAIDSFGTIGGGVYFPLGTYTVSSTITLRSNVMLWGQHGVELVWTGGAAAVMFTMASTGTTALAGISGMTLNCGNALKCLELRSAYRCTFTDITINSNSNTNILIDLLCNSTGTPNIDTNYNTVFNYFENVLQDGTCGTLLRLRGNTDAAPAQVCTLNTFQALNSLSVKVRGIDFSRWCDSNVFTGMTRIAVYGAGGVGVEFNTDAPTSENGVYQDTFDHLAVDCFGSVGGRISVKLNLCKLIQIRNYFSDPQGEAGRLVVSAFCYSYDICENIALNNFWHRTIFGGFLTIGGTTALKYSIYTNSFALRGTNQASVLLADTFSSDAAGTSCAGLVVANHTQASVWTLGSYYAISIDGVTPGAGSNVQNVLGIRIGDITQGASANFGLHTSVSAGANKWNVYAPGTATSYFDGGLFVRTGLTTAVDGFVNISAAAGPPVGVALSAVNGNAPLYMDYANNKLYVYSSTDGSTGVGKWRSTIALTT